MIKLKFKNTNDSSDVIIIPVAKAYISEFDDDYRYFGVKTDRNTKVTLYDDTVSILQYIDVPKYDDLLKIEEFLRENELDNGNLSVVLYIQTQEQSR